MACMFAREVRIQYDRGKCCVEAQNQTHPSCRLNRCREPSALHWRSEARSKLKEGRRDAASQRSTEHRFSTSLSTSLHLYITI